ncbi:MAG: 30S ribosomal protein S24e [Methanocellales archaeon]|nr:30S ribosomal protein S24e [Methanocellales archaeon]
MNIEVIEKKVNPLLKRLEIMFKVDHEGATPSREEVRKNLAAMLNEKKELVIIERMRSEYGKRETHVYAKIYKSEKLLKEIERAHIIQRNVLAEGEEKVEKVETKKEPEQKPEEKKAKEKVEKVETKKEPEQKPEEKKAKEKVGAKSKINSKGE